MQHDIEFTFRGLQIAGQVAPEEPATREQPGVRKHVEDFEILGIEDSGELGEWLEEKFDVHLDLIKGRMSLIAKEWIEREWESDIFEAANRELDV